MTSKQNTIRNYSAGAGLGMLRAAGLSAGRRPVLRPRPLQTMFQSYISKGISRQGIGSFVRKSYVSTQCPVVICRYLCTSECWKNNYADASRLPAGTMCAVSSHSFNSWHFECRVSDARSIAIDTFRACFRGARPKNADEARPKKEVRRRGARNRARKLMSGLNIHKHITKWINNLSIYKLIAKR